MWCSRLVPNMVLPLKLNANKIEFIIIEKIQCDMIISPVTFQDSHLSLHSMLPSKQVRAIYYNCLNSACVFQFFVSQHGLPQPSIRRRWRMNSRTCSWWKPTRSASRWAVAIAILKWSPWKLNLASLGSLHWHVSWQRSWACLTVTPTARERSLWCERAFSMVRESVLYGARERSLWCERVVYRDHHCDLAMQDKHWHELLWVCSDTSYASWGEAFYRWLQQRARK